MSRRRRAAQEDSIDQDQLEDAQREAHELQEERARVGKVARELQLRELATQHRAAFTSFVEILESTAAKARGDRRDAARRFLATFAGADAELLGMAGPVASWYIDTWLTSPILAGRLLEPGSKGDWARARLIRYVKQHALRPGYQALWKQLGGGETEPRPT